MLFSRFKQGELTDLLKISGKRSRIIPAAGKCIMEVKFTEFLPQFVRDLLPDRASEFTALSKYVLCYEKTEYMNNFKYWYEN